MNYEDMSNIAIDVEVDCYLSMCAEGMREAYDMSESKHWGKLASDNKISIVFIDDIAMAFNYFGQVSNEHADNDIGRAVSICYLKMMKSK